MKLTLDSSGFRVRVGLEELILLQSGEAISGALSLSPGDHLHWRVSLSDAEVLSWLRDPGRWEISLPRAAAERLIRKAELGAGRKELFEPCGIPGLSLELDYFDVKKKERSLAP